MFQSLLAASGMVLLLAVPAATPAARPSAFLDGEVDGVQQHIVIHVPRMTVTSTTFVVRRAAPVAMVERKAKNCIDVDHLEGFTVNTANSVDLILDDGSLLRAKLGSECPALGFYNGAYVRPPKDKRLCAGRDSLRSRSGRACAIQAFKKLEPAR